MGRGVGCEVTLGVNDMASTCDYRRMHGGSGFLFFFWVHGWRSRWDFALSFSPGGRGLISFSPFKARGGLFHELIMSYDWTSEGKKY